MKKPFLSFWRRLLAAYYVLTAPSIILFAGQDWRAKALVLHNVTAEDTFSITECMREIIRDEVNQEATLREAQEVLDQPWS
ncbi:hypothetical protein SAMN06265337_0667 [Hymenobacter gelipurpurascens]|uniref:Uncharacterized protein n=1 Tax=Hymenobacter gelipurpurascens TaxID=89968 RepID=A0A212T9F4_9BACT|nr:hypothetical protein [Hymenobacter gelipurpurascens]SNC62424.1 hypothetical protein SAMN06265337_0667 [Hymenobacter gelipurpurascens]